MWFTLILIAIGLSLAYLYLTWNFKYWKNQGVLGPSAVPLAGSFPASFFQRKSMVYDVDDVYKKFRGVVPFIGYINGRSPAVMILDQQLVKNVLITNFRSFQDNEFGLVVDKESDPIAARNPFMLTGDEWKEKRAEITPAFTNSRMKAMFPIVTDVCSKLNTYLNNELKKEHPNGFDANELSSKFTTDVVSSCIYGFDSKSFSLSEPSVIRQEASKIFDFSTRVLVYLAICQVLPIVSKFYKLSLIRPETTAFFTKLMDQAVNLRKSSNINREDYLNYLIHLQEKKQLKTIDMAAHTVTFFLDGIVTSAQVIALNLYFLARNPRVQQKLRTEIKENSQKNDNQITYEGIGEMEYLDQVFHETMRINPVGFGSMKRCTIETEFLYYNNKKIKIQPGIPVMIPLYSIHHDPEYYPNPEEFRPERFDAENGGIKKFKDDAVYLAFGEGPRICLGMRFATLQVKSAIVEIIRNNQVTVNPKTKEPFIFDPKSLLLMPVGGIWLDIKPI